MHLLRRDALIRDVVFRTYPINVSIGDLNHFLDFSIVVCIVVLIEILESFQSLNMRSHLYMNVRV